MVQINRRRMMGSKKIDGYKQLNCIINTSNSIIYIDGLNIDTSKHNYEFGGTIKPTSYDSYGAWFAAKKTGGAGSYFIGVYKTVKSSAGGDILQGFWLNRTSYDSQSILSKDTVGIIQKYSLVNGLWTVNDVPHSQEASPLVDTLDYLILGGLNTYEIVRGEYYDFYVKEDGVDIIHLTPVQRLSDGKVGMLDTVNNIFYSSYTGKNEYIAG